MQSPDHSERGGFWSLCPAELRTLADECERRGGSYVELVAQDYCATITTTVKLDDESGGERFTVDEDGRVLA